MKHRVLTASLLFLVACSDCGESGPEEEPIAEGMGRVTGTLTPFDSASRSKGPWDARYAGLAQAAREAVQRRAGGQGKRSALQSTADASQVIPGEVVLRLEAPNASIATVLAKAQVPGYQAVYKGQATPYLHLVAYTPTAQRSALTVASTRALAATVSSAPGVRFAENNFRVYAQRVPNDRGYPLQWNYPALNLPAAWDITTGSSSVVVAVVDTGIVPHPDLDGRVLPGIDMISEVANAGDGNARDNNPLDEGGDGPQGNSSSWHGTHVAGTIGAVSDNDIGVCGVDWNARILPVRVLGQKGGSSFDVVAGMHWAAGGTVAGVRANTTPAKIINLSLGSPSAPVQAYQDVIDEHSALGVLFVVAAGNENVNATGSTPCNQQNVICVGAVGLSGKRSSYSNFGAPVDVMAPGGEMIEDLNGDDYPDGILSTLRDEENEPAFVFLEGTSMATPHVSGVLALMASVKPDLSLALAESILKQTASASSTCSQGCGSGLVNAQAAVLRAQGSVGSVTPSLGVTTNSLFFKATRTEAKPTQNLLVTNLGGGTLSVTAVAQGGHSSAVSFPSGNTLTVGANATASLAIRVDTSGLAAGEYNDTTLLLTGAEGAGTQTVSLRIRAGVAVDLDAFLAFAYYVEATDTWVVKDEFVMQVPAAGGYQYQIDLPERPVGGYYALATINEDEDEDFFEEGERVGFWRSADAFEEIPVEEGAVTKDISFKLLPFTPVDAGN